MIKIQSWKGGYDRNFCYLVIEGKTGILIDPFPEKEILEKAKVLENIFIINTHKHFDHVSGNKYFKENAKAAIVSEYDKSMKLGEISITVIATPGHTPESKCFLIGDNLFTGDTLFVGKIGGTSTKQQARQECESLKRLMELPDATKVYPGHDYGVKPVSTVGFEKKHNPFIQRVHDFKELLWLKEHWQEYKKRNNIS